MPKVDTMSTVKNQICKVIPQLSPSKSLPKKRSVKEKSTKEQSSKEKLVKEKASKEKVANEKLAKEKVVKSTKEQNKKGKPEKPVKKAKSSTEPGKESLSFKDLNSHFSSVQFSTKQTGQRSYGNGDAISGQIDSPISQLPDGNDLEERSSTSGFPVHFIDVGASFKNQIFRPEDDDR